MINDLIGIKYKPGACSMAEADCLGIVVLYARLILGIDFGFDGWGVLDSDQRAAAFNKEQSKSWRKVAKAKPGAVAVFYPKGSKSPDHYGIMIDNENVLHSGARTGFSVVQEISEISAYFYKLEYYEWQQ